MSGQSVNRFQEKCVLERTLINKSVSKPHSLTHINFPISIIYLHINPKTALSSALMFLTMSLTPLAFPTLSWHEKSNWGTIALKVKRGPISFQNSYERILRMNSHNDSFKLITLTLDAIWHQELQYVWTMINIYRPVDKPCISMKFFLSDP